LHGQRKFYLAGSRDTTKLAAHPVPVVIMRSLPNTPNESYRHPL
jgi:hypothetical protein